MFRNFVSTQHILLVQHRILDSCDLKQFSNAMSAICMSYVTANITVLDVHNFDIITVVVAQWPARENTTEFDNDSINIKQVVLCWYIYLYVK